MASSTTTLGRQLGLILLLLASLAVIGAAGYMLLEGWPITEALYMTVITLSTVGFGEVRPLTPVGRGFTMLLILLGVGVAAYLFSSLADYIIAGELRGTLQRRRMQRKIDALKDHYIVCGYGRVGKQVVQELKANGAQVVIVEKDEGIVTHAVLPELFVTGDASDDELLRRAGIKRANGLVAAAGSDAENVFITLSARALKRDLTIVARGIMSDAERKLRKAGADQVIFPHAIGGRRMAGVLMRPTVVDFLDLVMHSGDLELRLEEIEISDDSELCNRSVGVSNVRSRTGANILAVKTTSGQLLTDVGIDYVLRTNDRLVALGTRQQLYQLRLLAGGAVTSQKNQ